MTTSTEKTPNRKFLAIAFVFSFFLVSCDSTQSGFQDLGSQAQNEICQQSIEPTQFFQSLASARRDFAESSSDVLREREVQVDVASLRDTVLKTRRFKLALFDDTHVSIQAESLQREADQTLIITGRVVDQLQSSVTFVIRNQTLIGNLSLTSGLGYEISSRGNGVHVIREFERVEEHEECEAVESSDSSEKTFSESGSFTSTAVSALPMIDMLVAYTPSAKARAGGRDAIEATIRLGIADTNKAFLDSGVFLSVRLVGVMEVSADDTGDFHADLSSLKSKSDGRWDEVHAERVRTGADQVTLISTYPNNGVAGVGYIGATYSSAFTIVKLSAFRMFTFSHELGHNIGLNHRDGFQNFSGNFRTVMAYGTQPRIRRFSHPKIPYNNYLTGNSEHNSAAILNAYGRRVSEFSPTVVPVTDTNVSDVPASPVECL